MKFKTWGVRLGFFLALVTSASGLGNLWRFPYVVSENGGGGFVWLYVFLVLVVGTPLLVSELLLGRVTGKSILASISEFKAGRVHQYIANFSLVLCLVVLGYFSVISSWVLFYFVKYCLSLFGGDVVQAADTLKDLLNNGWLQFLLTAFHISVLITVISRDIEGGVERFVGYLMPLFGVLLGILVWKSLSLDASEEALRFLFYPNFSNLTWSSLSSALGQVLFTLSLGFTTMITFGSLLPKDSNLIDQSVGIAVIDSLMSLMAGMLVFPLILGMSSTTGGPLLLFEAVPEFFKNQENGELFGSLFFMLLYLGALAGSISLFETVVINLKEYHEVDRTSSSFITGGMAFIMAILPVLSISYYSHVTVKEKTLLVFWDHVLVNWILPLTALIISQWIYYKVPHEKKEEFLKSTENSNEKYLFGQWLFMLKWVVPAVVMLAFILNIVGYFKS